jgi:hypothetical protein
MCALAGIATVIQPRTGLTYMAGLWKELLPLDMLWYKMDDPEPNRIPLPDPPLRKHQAGPGLRYSVEPDIHLHPSVTRPMKRFCTSRGIWIAILHHCPTQPQS